MAFNRRAEAVWTGDVPTGGGEISFKSGALPAVPYSFSTRFGDRPGTNPEELLAAAHAACYSMALTFFLGNNGQQPKRIDTTAVCTVEPVEGGFKISKMTLQVSGEVPGLTQEQFAAYATQAEGVCPVSNALRNNLEITLEAKLT